MHLKRSVEIIMILGAVNPWIINYILRDRMMQLGLALYVKYLAQLLERGFDDTG